MGKTIDTILAMDCETSGINWSSGDGNIGQSVANGYQTVSWGLVVSDAKTFKPINELYVEIKWNGESHWDSKAEKVHGLSKEYLEEHGMDEVDAVVTIVEFIMDNMDVKKPIYALGHNVASFDLVFFKDMLSRYNISGLKFGQRHFDTFSLSMGTVKAHDSNDLFEAVGLPVREEHNSLEDAKYSLETYKRINRAWNKMINSS